MRIRWGYLVATILIAVSAFFVTLWLSPQSGQTLPLIIAVAVAAVLGAVSFVANWKKTIVDESNSPSTETTQTQHSGVQIAGSSTNSDNVGRDKIGTKIEGDQVDGDKVAGDKITIINEAASAVTSLHQLPPPPADFTGREAELNELLANFDKGITISGLRGMGGVGKTALALVIANRLKDDYPDAQFFLNLQGVSEKPLTSVDAMAHIIRAYYPDVKAPEADTPELRGLYRSALDGKRVLLLMDNSSDAAQIEPLLPPEGCCLIVTSRNKFYISGLVEKDLDTLSDVDARALLLRIAPRIGESADEIAKLCGNLPLALTVSASTLREHVDLSPADLFRRLQDTQKRLKLTGVEASLSLSFDLLSTELKKLWPRLAVFPADFDRRAAQAVWEIENEDEAQDRLSELRLRSLVEFNNKTERYRLHDLTRAFANSKLSEAERYEAQKQHAIFYAYALEHDHQLYLKGGNSVLLGLALFDLERVNIEQGQKWAAEHVEKDEGAAEACNWYAGQWNILNLRLHPRQHIQWLHKAIIAARRLNHRQAESAHLGNSGLAYYTLGESRKAIAFYEQHLTIAREIGDRRGEGNALGNLGTAYLALGEIRKAIDVYEKRLVIAREISDRRGEGHVLGNLGGAYETLGETHKAIELCKQSLVVKREIGDRRGEGNSWGNLGLAYYTLGEVHKAIEFFEQHLMIAREIGDRRGEANSLMNIGNAYAALGETRKAIEFYEQALVIAREIGDRRGEGQDLGNLGKACAALGEYHKSIEYHEQALVIAREIGDRQTEDAATGNLGVAYTGLGETRNAIEYYEQALKIDREIGDRRGEGNALGNLGNAYFVLGETRKAIEFYEQQLTIVREIGDRRGEGSALGSLGNAYFVLGETRKAIEYYEQALKIDREIGDRRGEGNALGNLGNAYFVLGETRKAIEFYEKQLTITREIDDRRGEGNALWNMSLALEELGDRKNAITCAEAALKICEEIEDPNAEKVRKQLAEWRGGEGAGSVSNG